jgi:hypothetical protein
MQASSLRFLGEAARSQYLARGFEGALCRANKSIISIGWALSLDEMQECAVTFKYVASSVQQSGLNRTYGSVVKTFTRILKRSLLII